MRPLPYGVKSTMVEGDALKPKPLDLIAQTGLLDTSQPVPAGWIVLTGNAEVSRLARIIYRQDIDAENQA